ncbi:MAG: hypothetical protein IKQ61_03040 [Spirochaetales bacterium]|nr:hypothetical protein [Spirochaetales bacterium]MBR6199224.1 hypothetical protein [Spirochaetales bacterium]
MLYNKILTFTMLLILLAGMQVFAASQEDIDRATEKTMNYRLDVKNCPTLQEVADKQLVDIRWSNPGGGDQNYCFVKLQGFQKNHEFFSVIFKYDVISQRTEPYSVRRGSKETFKIDEVQRQLMRFYATESMEVWQLMKRAK